MNNYIFLDIDGVLNSKLTGAKGPYGNPGIGKKHLEILKTIVEKTDGKIVLISDWRLSFLPNDHMPKMANYISKKLASMNLSLLLVSESPRYEKRVDEIARWIRCNPTKGYIIIDDTEWPGYEMEKIRTHLILTDNRYGLEEKHIEAAVAKMLIPVEQPIIR